MLGKDQWFKNTTQGYYQPNWYIDKNKKVGARKVL